MISIIQHFEANFLWKVSLKILNSGIILKSFTHEVIFARLEKTVVEPGTPGYKVNGLSITPW